MKAKESDLVLFVTYEDSHGMMSMDAYPISLYEWDLEMEGFITVSLREGCNCPMKAKGSLTGLIQKVYPADKVSSAQVKIDPDQFGAEDLV